MFRRRKTEGARVESMMTPMIDVVFQLLIFFMLSFKIVALEGEFAIKVPQWPTAASAQVSEILPLHLRLAADSNGQLAHIELNGRSYRDWGAVRNFLTELTLPDANRAAAAAWEIEVDADPTLPYRHVVDAMTAVSGYIDESGAVVPLVRQVRFGARR